MEEHSENVLGLGVLCSRQRNKEEREKNEQYYGFFKHQAFSMISSAISVSF